MRSARRIDVTLQIETTECGAACLAMALSAFGRFATLEEVRTQCGTSRDGVTAAGLVRAAAGYGLRLSALRREPEELGKLPMPQILHWGFEHFVVLERVRNGRFHLLDPAMGRRVIARDEFGKAFTGLTLVAEPDAGFKRGGRRPSVLGALTGIAATSRDAMGFVLVCGIIGVLPGIALAGAISVFTDFIASGMNSDWAPFVFLALLSAAFVQAALAMLRTRVIAALRAKISVIVGAQSFWHALRLPLGFFAQRHAGEIVGRLRAGSELGSVVAGPLAQFLPNLIVAAIYAGLILLYDVITGAAVTVIAFLSFQALVVLGRRVAEANRLEQMTEARATGVGVAGIAGYGAYRNLGREGLLLAQWMSAEDRALAVSQQVGLLRTLASVGPIAAALLLAIVALVFGALRVMEGDLSLGGLLAIQILAGFLAQPVSALANGVCEIQEAAGALARLDDLRRYPAEVNLESDVVAAEPAAPHRTVLCLRQLSFGYDKARPIFEDIDFEIVAGQIVALVGPSGSGKSTLARIAAGLVRPDSGEVVLNGVALREWPRAALARKIAYVPQASAMFTGTVADNLSLWDEAIAPNDIVDALRTAEAFDFVSRQKAGLSTKMSSQSPALSGGEMQRIALARAIAQKPDIVILDETTSALDALTEAKVMDGLKRIGVGVLVVTHRYSTAARCDLVYELADGVLKRLDGRAPAGETAA